NWFHLTALALLAMAGLLAGGRLASAQDEKKEGGEKPLLDVKDELKAGDPMDKVRMDSFCKIHEVKLQAGKTYKIAMKSTEIDPFLRLEDDAGKQLAFDDDSGGGPKGLDARIVHTIKKDGSYKIIATTYEKSQTGKYTLTVVEASKAELASANAKE